jgi:hypothetical protein
MSAWMLLLSMLLLWTIEVGDFYFLLVAALTLGS